MNWKYQLLAENAVAVLPFQRYRRKLKRRHTKPAERMKLLETSLERAIQQVELLRQHGIDPRGRTGMEIGTGWHPMNAFVQSLAGAQRVYLVNASVEYDQDSVLASVFQLSQWSTVLGQRLGIAEEEIEERCLVRGGTGVGQIFESFGIVSLAPCDARQIDLADGSIDYITSHDTLARVPEQVLTQILGECQRLLYPSGIMCHLIDNSDPWAHKDKTISKIHFLRHSDGFWAFCCMNPENYRNRLRHSQYRAMFQKAGFEVVHQSKKVDAKSLSALAALRVADGFARIAEKDLCAVSSSFVLQKTVPAHEAGSRSPSTTAPAEVQAPVTE